MFAPCGPADSSRNLYNSRVNAISRLPCCVPDRISTGAGTCLDKGSSAADRHCRSREDHPIAGCLIDARPIDERLIKERLLEERSLDHDKMAMIPAGSFQMGSDDGEGEPGDGEAPSRIVHLPSFRIDRTAVSNHQFAQFVAATQYVTVAEEVGSSFVFAGLLPDDFEPTRGVVDAPWWREVSGACWRYPEGRGSTIQRRADHPVVHVSWHDAMAYCEWAGKRLPSEAQWEYAARGGLHGKRFAWGDELTPHGEHRCNIWQGHFPSVNSAEDGYYGTAPVDAFAPNGWGLYNVCGNVWEWCADEFGQGTRRVIRGGSYLCHESYCNRYRVAARSSNEPIASTGHTGFRCAADISTDYERGLVAQASDTVD